MFVQNHSTLGSLLQVCPWWMLDLSYIINWLLSPPFLVVFPICDFMFVSILVCLRTSFLSKLGFVRHYIRIIWHVWKFSLPSLGTDHEYDFNYTRVQHEYLQRHLLAAEPLSTAIQETSLPFDLDCENVTKSIFSNQFLYSSFPYWRDDWTLRIPM